LSYSAVIFDLDGTLIDSEPVFKAVAKLAAIEFDQCFTDELYLALVGLPSAEVESGIFDAFGHDFPMNDFRARFALHWHEHVDANGIEIKPGALDLVNKLRDRSIPYAIATSTPHERARQSLKHAKLDNIFEHLIGGDQVDNGKPAPDIYLKAATTIGANPKKCIAIEDSKVGVRAAAAASMHTIMIPDLKSPDEETKNLTHNIFSSLDEAANHILSLLKT
jgi:HAD superfamily hydrolase (TIGR01509 family)